MQQQSDSAEDSDKYLNPQHFVKETVYLHHQCDCGQWVPKTFPKPSSPTTTPSLSTTSSPSSTTLTSSANHPPAAESSSSPSHPSMTPTQCIYCAPNQIPEEERNSSYSLTDKLHDVILDKMLILTEQLTKEQIHKCWREVMYQ